MGERMSGHTCPAGRCFSERGPVTDCIHAAVRRANGNGNGAEGPPPPAAELGLSKRTSVLRERFKALYEEWRVLQRAQERQLTGGVAEGFVPEGLYDFAESGELRLVRLFRLLKLCGGTVDATLDGKVIRLKWHFEGGTRIVLRNTQVARTPEGRRPFSADNVYMHVGFEIETSIDVFGERRPDGGDEQAVLVLRDVKVQDVVGEL